MLLTSLRESPKAHAGAVDGIYLGSPLSGSQGDASLSFFRETTSPVAEPPSAAPGFETALSAAISSEWKVQKQI